ncbi:MAG TPA: hypothetical protein VID24_11250 [Candidatus Eremiobacteraceae bacterium]|jgi:hypothetical protein
MLNRRFTISILSALVCIGVVGASASQPATKQAVMPPEQVTTCDSRRACLSVENSDVGAGVVGRANKASGVKGEILRGKGAPNSLLAGVSGVDTSNSGFTNGVSGVSNTGNGGYFKTLGGLNALIAESDNFDFHVEGHSTVLVMGPNNSVPELLMFSRGNASGFPIADVDDVHGKIFYFTSTGDLHLKGNIFTSGSCSTGCLPIRNAEGKAMTAYTARQPLPTIEDVGESQLVAGVARVAIDPQFAATIDSRQPYLVFITPDGQSKGLYVSAKARQSFEVRENLGGRSTLIFDYRIVAKPLDTSASTRFGAPVQDQETIEPTIPKQAP